MPLLFSYGTLQQEDVQISTLGRRLSGQKDALVAFARSVEETHANVKFTGNAEDLVPGMLFEVTDGELAKIDKYEIAFFYRRVATKLASGRQAWVYTLETIRA